MTDVDRLLTEDGARWRATQSVPPEPDPALFTRPRRPRWQPIAAAAAVVVVAAGAVTVVTLHRAPDPAPAPVATSPGPIVHDGDRVTGTTWISAVPGKPVRICGGAPTRNAGVYPDGRRFPGEPIYCANGYDVVGVDLHRLASREVLQGTVLGIAQLTGVYRAGTITVTEQRGTTDGFDDAYRRPFYWAVPADCSVPAGGWPSRGRVASADAKRISRYVEAHPTAFGSTTIRFPNGRGKDPWVLMVTTPGDVAAAARAVRGLYNGPLCIRAVPASRAQMVSARAALSQALNDTAVTARYRLVGTDGELDDAGGGPYTDLAPMIWTDDVERFRQSLGAEVVRIFPVLRKMG